MGIPFFCAYAWRRRNALVSTGESQNHGQLDSFPLQIHIDDLHLHMLV